MIRSLPDREVRRLDTRAFVESIVRELLQSVKEEKEKQSIGNVLFILCDSAAQGSFSDQFIKLKNEGVCYDILCLDGETSSWLGLHRVECGGARAVIAADEHAPAPIELPKEYDGIVIPEIDLDNAARVIAGMKGTIKAEIIFSALVLQKFILVGEDSPGIKRSDRRCLNALSLPPAYEKLFRQYVNDMKTLGLEFKPQNDMAEAVIEKLKAKQPAKLFPAVDRSKQDTFTFRGKLLTADWLSAQSDIPDKTIYLPKGTIVSPLALDLMKEKKLAVQYIGKG